MTQPAAQSAPRAAFAPLTGRRVLEWCSYAAGPMVGKILAALGADVIKIEAPLVGDEARAAGPFLNNEPDPETSALYLYLNNGKRSVTLDPTTADGRRIFLRLLDWADLLVEDRAPALMEQTDLTYATLAQAKPGLVMLSITPFGQTGPNRDLKIYPSQTSHAGGAAYSQPNGFLYEPEVGIPPTQWPRLVSEYSAGTEAAFGALAALLAKDMTGQGQHIDLSKQESQMHPIRTELDSYPNEGIVRKRQNAPRPAGTIDRFSISGTMACADGYVTLWPLVSYMPANLVEWLGNPTWSQEARWTDVEQRQNFSTEFRGLVMEGLLPHTKADIYDGLQAKNVSVAPVYSAEEVLRGRQNTFRQFFHTVQDPDAGALPYATLPFKLSTAADPTPGVAPRLGQHNQEVLAGMLGLTSEELTTLHAQRVV